jgi:flagellar FliJ protein
MFNFRLQPVLDYRKQVEDKLLSEFAGIKKRLDIEKRRLEELRSKKKGLISRLEEMGEGQLRPADVSVYVSYINHTIEQEKNQEEVAVNLERELKAKRLNLIDAMKQRKMLEIIREKKLKEHRLCINEKETKVLDELGTLRYGRF